MQVKCDYCDHYIDDTDAVCPHCGAPNDRMMRSGEGIPKTVEELKEFCQAHGLPLKQMRFFIGEDYQQPRAFGIYQNGEGDFIVYKNKADGSRIIRYRGEDESYAVNEIYQKMRTELQERRGQGQVGNKRVLPSSDGGGNKTGGGRGRGEKLFGGRRPGCLRGCLIAIIIFAVLALIGAFVPGERDTAADHGSSSYGYYEDDGDTYYYDDDDTYYDDDDGYDSSSDSGWFSWDDDDDWSSDWDDDDWDWDSGDSWDSGSSDWDSDW